MRVSLLTGERSEPNGGAGDLTGGGGCWQCAAQMFGADAARSRVSPPAARDAQAALPAGAGGGAQSPASGGRPESQQREARAPHERGVARPARRPALRTARLLARPLHLHSHAHREEVLAAQTRDRRAR